MSDEPKELGPGKHARVKKLVQRPRNDLLFDMWSLVHIASGVIAALVMPPFVAFTLLVLWEPLEILVLSPLLARFGIRFGHESLRNSLSDIVFDGAGVLVGHMVFGQPWDLFGMLGLGLIEAIRP